MMLIDPDMPALVLAPMDGVTDAPMRSLQGEAGAFTFAVSEFLRVSAEVPPKRVFLREIPELAMGGLTPSGLPVQVQILGGDPGRMAEAACVAIEAGAIGIDINFGCPAPTVNRHDGGAALLRHPSRIRSIVSEIRSAVPKHIPVSAKLRLGWDSMDSIFENAEMAAEGGASWLTIHGRTKMQGYAPPAHWEPIGIVRERLNIPVVANGDIWSLDDFRRCREVTGSKHFMIGRGALANPLLSWQISNELGISRRESQSEIKSPLDWIPRLQKLVTHAQFYDQDDRGKVLRRIKQWLSLASRFGDFRHFDSVKRAESTEELFCLLSLATHHSEPQNGNKTPQISEENFDCACEVPAD